MKLRVGLVMLIAFVVLAAYCLAEPTNYTATMAMNGNESPYAKDGQKIRMEMTMGRGGMGKMVTIMRGDLQKSYMLNPEQKAYFENTTQRQNRRRTPSVYEYNPDYKIDKIKTGTETIDNHPCIKYTVTITNTKSGDKYTGTIWEATDLQSLPIKNEMVSSDGNKSVYELKNIKLKAATADMFEIPAGYKKVDNMMQLMGMGNMGNMPGMPGGRQPRTDNSNN
jgi:hypothetical protein